MKPRVICPRGRCATPEESRRERRRKSLDPIHAFPHYRKVLSLVAIRRGYLFNQENPSEERINECIHGA